jgi:NitT/TauT family transport system substrate-binding protein
LTKIVGAPPPPGIGAQPGRPPARRVLSGCVALGLAAGLAACGSAPASSNSQTQKSLTNITLAQGTDSLLWAPLYIAQANGYFAANGVRVLTPVTGSTVAVTAVLSGSATAAATGMSDGLASAAAGKPVVDFASVDVRSTDDVVVSKAFAARANLGPHPTFSQRVSALKGATIGITGTGAETNQEIEWVFKKYGLPATAATYEPLSTPAAALAALEHNEVQAIIYPPPTPQSAIVAGAAVQWLQMGAAPLDDGFWLGLITSQSSLKQHRAALLGLSKAVQEGLKFIRTSPAQAKKIVRSFFSTETTQQFNEGWDASVPGYATSVAVTPQQLQSVESFIKAIGQPAPSQGASTLLATSLSEAAAGA